MLTNYLQFWKNLNSLAALESVG